MPATHQHILASCLLGGAPGFILLLLLLAVPWCKAKQCEGPGGVAQQKGNAGLLHARVSSCATLLQTVTFTTQLQVLSNDIT